MQVVDLLQMEGETMKWYISGKISGLPTDQVTAKFKQAEQQIRAFGHEPVNPTNNGLGSEASWNEHLVADVALLLECDAIYLLKDWATAGDRASRRISPRSAACRSFTSRNMRPMRAACEQLAGALLRFTEAMRSCNSALRRYSAVMPKQRYKPLQGNRTRKTKRLTCLQRRRKKTN